MSPVEDTPDCQGSVPHCPDDSCRSRGIFGQHKRHFVIEAFHEISSRKRMYHNCRIYMFQSFKSALQLRQMRLHSCIPRVLELESS